MTLLAGTITFAVSLAVILALVLLLLASVRNADWPAREGRWRLVDLEVRVAAQEARRSRMRTRTPASISDPGSPAPRSHRLP